jgi:type IV pilus biogenesis protein CpaD/CtpE
MTRIKQMSIDQPQRVIARALMLAGFVATLAACADYGPSTSSAIQSDIDSSRWVNQLPPETPDMQSPAALD